MGDKISYWRQAYRRRIAVAGSADPGPVQACEKAAGVIAPGYNIAPTHSNSLSAGAAGWRQEMEGGAPATPRGIGYFFLRLAELAPPALSIVAKAACRITVARIGDPVDHEHEHKNGPEQEHEHD